jgi:hypothetical protein
MSFLYPSFFWALAVLSVPVIIHLFNFKRTTRVFFSNTRFLKKVKESTTAKRRLKHYLILSSRLLFLFFLVITFCQPFIPASQESVNHHNVVLYLDNSQSMSIAGRDKTKRLEDGISFIRTLLEVFPSDARYRLITNDFAPFSNTFKSRNEIEELLTQLRISPVSRSMKEIMNRISEQDDTHRPEVFFVSDFQRSTLGTLNLSTISDSLVKLHLVPVPIETVSNVFVDTAYLENPFAAGGEKNVLIVRLRNQGTQTVEQIPVKLTINSIQAGTATVSILAGGVSETRFDLTGNLQGFNKAEVQFNDFPVTFDNQFYLSLSFGEKIRVLEIKATNEETPVAKVFGNASVFQYQGFNVSNFNYNALKNADLVVVNGLNTIDAGLSAPLLEHINAGKTIFVAPGTEADLGSYQRFLPMVSLQKSTSQSQLEIDKPDFNNPFFENVFEERSPAMVMPKAMPVFSWQRDRNSILKFKNENAFLTRVDFGGGVYLLASPLDNAFTDFYNHAIFVPVMYRIASSSKRESQQLYYTLNDNFISLRVENPDPATQFRLIRKEEVIPEQRVLGDRVMIDIPKFTMSEGFYNVVGRTDTLGVLAFNLEKVESLLEQVPAIDVKTALGSKNEVTIFDSGSSETFSNEIKERYLGTPLWKYSLVLALLFVAIEILLIRFLK